LYLRVRVFTFYYNTKDEKSRNDTAIIRELEDILGSFKIDFNRQDLLSHLDLLKYMVIKQMELLNEVKLNNFWLFNLISF
jgi:hypothetical protein